MTRRGALIAALPTTALALALWVIETLVPNLIPIPARWGWIAVIVAAVAATVVLFIRGVLSVARRHPGPWIARPFWRSGRWLRERPQVSILLASAKATFGISTLDTLTVSLTVHRSAARGRRPGVILFEDAVLTLAQQYRGELRTWRLRPDECDGFLAVPLPAGHSDQALIVFTLIALPLASSHAPDLNRSYSLTLDRVTGELQGGRPVSGRLPKAKWETTRGATPAP